MHRLFAQCGADVIQHLFAQQHKGLLGAACGHIGAAHVFPGKEVLGYGACSGAGVAEEAGAGQIKPLFQRSGIKAGADGSVEQHLACAQLGKLIFAQQQHVLVQAGEHHLALSQQLSQRLKGHTDSLGIRL